MEKIFGLAIAALLGISGCKNEAPAPSGQAGQPGPSAAAPQAPAGQPSAEPTPSAPAAAEKGAAPMPGMAPPATPAAPGAVPPAAVDAAKAPPMAFDAMPPVGTKATCPVAKERFVVGQKTAHATHKGKTYVFCCADCKPEFERSPDKFATP